MDGMDTSFCSKSFEENFELVVLPGTNYTLGGEFGEHKRYDFFVKHLMGGNPPAWDTIKAK